MDIQKDKNNHQNVNELEKNIRKKLSIGYPMCRRPLPRACIPEGRHLVFSTIGKLCFLQEGRRGLAAW
jgi:hypothetical protein